MKADLNDIFDVNLTEAEKIALPKVISTEKFIAANSLLKSRLVKQDVHILYPFNLSESEKQISSGIFKEYLNEIKGTLYKTGTVLRENQRLFPALHKYQGKYYLFAGLGGFVRDRHSTLEEERIEFLYKRLGAGAFGEVFETATVVFNQNSFEFRFENEKPRAVKKVKIKSADATFYINEVRMMKLFPYADYKLKNAFVVREGNEHYLYIPFQKFIGRTLKDYLKNNPNISPQTALNFVEKIGEAVDYCHYYGIIHSDIKSSNMFVLEPSLNIKFIDYGLAFHISQKIKDPRGTPRMMAPECFQGEVNKFTDQYSAIVTMAECFGARPRDYGNYSPQTRKVINITSASRVQRFDGIFSNMPTLRMEYRQSLLGHFQAGTHPIATARLPLSTVVAKARNINANINMDRLNEQIAFANTLAKAIAREIKSGAMMVLETIQTALPKLEDHSAVINAFLTALNIKELKQSYTKAEIVRAIENLKDKMAATECFVSLYELELDKLDFLKLPEKSRFYNLCANFVDIERHACISVRQHFLKATFEQWEYFWQSEPSRSDSLTRHEMRKHSLAAIKAIIDYRYNVPKIHFNLLGTNGFKEHKTKKQVLFYLRFLTSNAASLEQKMATLIAMLTSKQLPPNFLNSLKSTIFGENHQEGMENLKRLSKYSNEDLDKFIQKMNVLLETELSKRSTQPREAVVELKTVQLGRK